MKLKLKCSPPPVPRGEVCCIGCHRSFRVQMSSSCLACSIAWRCSCGVSNVWSAVITTAAITTAAASVYARIFTHIFSSFRAAVHPPIHWSPPQPLHEFPNLQLLVRDAPAARQRPVYCPNDSTLSRLCLLKHMSIGRAGRVHEHSIVRGSLVATPVNMALVVEHLRCAPQGGVPMEGGGGGGGRSDGVELQERSGEHVTLIDAGF